MDKWFTVDRTDEDTYIISEYRHWEETHCYLLIGSERGLLIDTGLGICNIYDEIVELDYDFSAVDRILPHPVYAWMSWICILNPSEDTFEGLKPYIQEAYGSAKEKFVRRK